MKKELLAFLQDHQKQVVEKWVDSMQDNSLVRAALPYGALKPLVQEVFEKFIELIGANASQKIDFTGFSYIKEHHISGIDTLLGLQTLLLKGKRALFDLTAKAIAERQKFIDFFQVIDEGFHRYILSVTSFYTLKSISPFYANAASSSELDDVHPSRLNLFYNAFQNSTDGFIITDRQGKIIEVNKAFQNIFGYAYDEVIGQTTAILRSESTTDAFYEDMWQTIKKEGSWKGEITNRKKNGEEIPVLLSITPIYENDKIAGYMGVEIDTRKQKEMEARLLHSQRFAVIGQMASKVAHEIRNPLSSISLNAELLEDEINAVGAAECGDAKSLLQSIMSEVDRLAVLTEEYLQFSRLPHIAPEQADLRKLIGEVLDFFEAEANSIGIQIRTSIAEKLPPLSFDAQQIRRLILNLLRNAAEAMPGGGVIHIELQHIGNAVRLSVADSGHGIPERRHHKIFEPFYTTKDMGTGLGLALCWQIVREHNGKIWVESKEKAGATFYVDLPVQRKASRKEQSKQDEA